MPNCDSSTTDMNILSAWCRPNSAGVIREAYSNYFTGEHGFYRANSIFECKQLRCETYTLRSSRTWCCSRKNYYGNFRENKTERWKLIISILLLEIESSPSYARGCPSYSISPYDEFSAGIDTQKKIVCHLLFMVGCYIQFHCSLSFRSELIYSL